MAKGRRASVHPSKTTQKPEKSTLGAAESSLQTINNDETASALNSSIMSGGISQSGNFFNDFKSYVQEFNAPSTLLKIVDRSEKNQKNNNNNNSENASDLNSSIKPFGVEVDLEDKLGDVVLCSMYSGHNWTDGPCIITTPNRAAPNVYHLRGFKIDIETMRAFLKAVESNPIRNVTIHISRCNLTPEAFDLFCSEANFTIINHLTLVGPLDKTKRKNFDLKKLFKVSLESLKLPCWGLDDNFMDESVDILQNNESLMLLCLDFNEFKRVDHVRSILRLNRKLMMLSLNNVVGKMRGQNDGDKIVDQDCYAAEMLEMDKKELKAFRSIKLKDNSIVPKILKSDAVSKKNGKVYFPGNNVFKKLIL